MPRTPTESSPACRGSAKVLRFAASSAPCLRHCQSDASRASRFAPTSPSDDQDEPLELSSMANLPMPQLPTSVRTDAGIANRVTVAR